MRQFKFAAITKIDLSATRMVMISPRSLDITLMLNADLIGAQNDPWQRPHSWTVLKENNIDRDLVIDSNWRVHCSSKD